MSVLGSAAAIAAGIQTGAKAIQAQGLDLADDFATITAPSVSFNSSTLSPDAIDALNKLKDEARAVTLRDSRQFNIGTALNRLANLKDENRPGYKNFIKGMYHGFIDASIDPSTKVALEGKQFPIEPWSENLTDADVARMERTVEETLRELHQTYTDDPMSRRLYGVITRPKYDKSTFLTRPTHLPESSYIVRQGIPTSLNQRLSDFISGINKELGENQGKLTFNKEDIFGVRRTENITDYFATIGTGGGRTVTIPINKGGHLEHVALFSRDGSNAFALPRYVGEIAEDGKSIEVQEAMDWLFSMEKGKIRDVLKESVQTGQSASDMIYNFQGGEPNSPFQLAEWIDETEQTALAQARKQSQIAIVDKNATRAASINPIDRFNEINELLGQHGIHLQPENSPGQVSKDLFMFTTSENSTTPLFSRMTIGEIGPNGVPVASPAIGTRLARPFTNPLKLTHEDVSTKTGFDALTDVRYGLDVEAKTVIKNSDSTFYTPLFYYKHRVDNNIANYADGTVVLSRATIKKLPKVRMPEAIDNLTVHIPGTSNSQEHFLPIHPRISELGLEARASKKRLSSRGRLRDLRSLPFNNHTDVMIGSHIENGRIVPVKLPARHKITKIIPTRTGYKIRHRGSDRLLHSGDKIEGSAKATIALLEGASPLPFSDDIGFTGSEVLRKTGNFRDLRWQQMTAFAMLENPGASQEEIAQRVGRLINESSHRNASRFIDMYRKANPNSTATQKDLEILNHLLISFNEENSSVRQPNNIGLIFGLDDELLKTLKDNNPKGTSKLVKGIEESKGVLGMGHFTVRNIPEEAGKIRVERRQTEALIAGIANGTISKDSPQFQILVNQIRYTSTSNKERNKTLSDIVKKQYSLMTTSNPANVLTTAQLDREVGGTIKMGNFHVYIPSLKETHAATDITSTGSATQNEQLLQFINEILETADQTAISIERKHKTLKNYFKFLFTESARSTAQPLEGIIEGGRQFVTAVKGTGLVDTQIEAMAKHASIHDLPGFKDFYMARLSEKNLEGSDYQLAKQRLDVFFDEVLEGREWLPIITGKDPQLGTHSRTIQRLYFSPDVAKGTIIDSRKMEEIAPDHYEAFTVGFADKISDDADGDKHNIAPLHEAIENNDVVADIRRTRTSYANDSVMISQYDEALDIYKEHTKYQGAIRKSLLKVAEDAAPTDLSSRAVMAAIKQYGQDDIGPLSNHMRSIREFIDILDRSKSSNKDVTASLRNFIIQAEQTAINFKHGTFRGGNYITEQLNTIFSNENIDDIKTGLVSLFKDLGFDKDLDSTISSESIAEWKASSAGRDAVVKAENQTAQTILHSLNQTLPNGDQIVDQTTRNQAAAIVGTVDDAATNTGGRIAGHVVEEINAKVHQAARSKGVSPEIKVNTEAAQQMLKTAETAVKGKLLNKWGRTFGLVGLALAGTYALFNKGYDDTPLTDVPPPPPGRMSVGLSNSTMSLVGSGRLLNDRYASNDQAYVQDIDEQGSVGIQPPSVFSQKAYINNGTARIENRNVQLGKNTNPVEYAMSLRQAIPNSQVNMNIRINNRIPRNLEDKL